MTRPAFVSVVVCTRDRPQALRRMLTSACGLRIPAGVGWELIVVDNGSGAGTAAVAREFEEMLPLRLVREPEPGLARARNRGLEAARGDYLCWTDDDVVVDPDWLAAYCDAFARHPEAALFGGRIIPRAEPVAAPWFARRMTRWPLLGPVAFRDMGEAEIPLRLQADRLPWGANFAVRALEQKATRFDPATGRLGDETELICRLLRGGSTGWWVPGSKVAHIIAPERQSRAYVRDYYRAAGIAAEDFQGRYPAGNPMAPGARAAWLDRGTGSLLWTARACSAFSAAAWRGGLVDLSLRFLARAGYLEGIVSARSGARHAAAPERAPALATP